MGLLDGRVVIVTGAVAGSAGRTPWRSPAKVPVVVETDIGVGLDGSPAGGGSAAQGVVDEIVAAGGSRHQWCQWSLTAQVEGLIQTAGQFLRS